jgi:hypothetical protein
VKNIALNPSSFLLFKQARSAVTLFAVRQPSTTDATTNGTAASNDTAVDVQTPTKRRRAKSKKI